MFRIASRLARIPSASSTYTRRNGLTSVSAAPSGSLMTHQLRSMSLIKTTITSADLYSQEADSVLTTIQERLEADDIDLEFDNQIDFSGDVLNIKTEKGTWVLNKHNVTKQLWLSSPISGPSKYNYHIPANKDVGTSPVTELRGGRWLSERDDTTALYDILTSEFTNIFDIPIEFEFKF